MTLEGAREAAARMLDGRLTLTQVRASLPGASGSVVFAARSEVVARGVTLGGGEHGLLLRDGRVRARDLAVSGAALAAVALVGATGRLERLALTGPFRTAGLLVVRGQGLRVEGLGVREAGALGLLATEADALEVGAAQVAGARTDAAGDFGHGLLLQQSTARVRALRVEDAEGAALYVSGGAVTVEGARAERVLAGVAATQQARVRITGLHALAPEGVGAMAWGRASVALEETVLRGRVGTVACPGARIDSGRRLVSQAIRGSGDCAGADPADWRQLLRP